MPRKKTQEEYEVDAFKRNLELKEVVLPGRSGKLHKYLCKICCWEFTATPNNVHQKTGCPKCGERKVGEINRIDLDKVKSIIVERGFVLNYHFYKEQGLWVNTTCSKNHDPETKRWGDFKKYNCNTCVAKYKYNKWEDGVFSKLLIVFPYLQQKVRRLLKNKRFHIDIWDPISRKAIELDGDYWHNRSAQAERDLRKNKECEEAGIKLLRIRYSEYIKDPDSAIDKMMKFMGNL